MGNVERRQGHAAERVIKRYSNRKLYDTKTSSYVTLMSIAEMVRAGEHVQVIDNATKEDKTDVTLALIISEELKANPREVPLSALRALLRNRGERLVHQLEEGPLGKLLGAHGEVEGSPGRGPGGGGPQGGRPEDVEGEAPPWGPLRPGEAQIDEESMDAGGEGRANRSFRATLEQWHHILDERIRAVLPHWAGFLEQERRLDELTRRVEQLERRLGAAATDSAARDPSGGNGGQRE